MTKTNWTNKKVREMRKAHDMTLNQLCEYATDLLGRKLHYHTLRRWETVTTLGLPQKTTLDVIFDNLKKNT